MNVNKLIFFQFSYSMIRCMRISALPKNGHTFLNVQKTRKFSHPLNKVYCTSTSSRQASTLPNIKIIQPMDANVKMTKDYFASLCHAANLSPKIAFIGGGNMAQALSKGFLKTGLLEKHSIAASDPVQGIRDYLEQKLEIRAYASNKEMLDQSDRGIIVLAVKPQYLDPVLDELAQHWKTSASKFGLLVSIVAGASIQKIQLKFTTDESLSPIVPIVRVMPNTPALIGCGASVYAKNSACTQTHGSVIKALMETVGICYEIPENHIDAVTGLAASGPAFIYTVIDALSDGGVKMGLPRDLATELSAQMVMGSAKMVLETQRHPGELKNQVCSPAGTTIAGVHVLEEAGIRGAFISAVEAATKRAKELN